MATILEKELEDFLFKNANEEGGIDYDDLYVPGRCFRQVSLGGYGIAGIVTINYDPRGSTLSIDIIELKKDSVDLAAVGQICRYKRGIERFINKKKDRVKYLRNATIEINCHLVGQKYSTGDVCYVVDSIPLLSFYKYDINLGCGMSISKSEGWYVVEENFKQLSSIFGKLKTHHMDELADCIKFYRRYLR